MEDEKEFEALIGTLEELNKIQTLELLEDFLIYDLIYSVIGFGILVSSGNYFVVSTGIIMAISDIVKVLVLRKNKWIM